jgi:chemotaxis family two-component system sensor kinase Cph1
MLSPQANGGWRDRMSDSTNPLGSLDLSSCEREQLHLLGSIESNGVMLILSEPDLVIVQASSNTLALLSAPPEALLGMPLKDLFPQYDTERIVAEVGTGSKRRHVNGLRSIFSETEFDALIHRHCGLLILELEPCSAPTAEETTAGIQASLMDALEDVDDSLPLAELAQRVATRVRHFTGFDRVMVYRFLKDDSGCVLAEDAREGLVPYLGLRYPASDIPAQARRFYLINTLRLKADVNANVAVLVPALNPLTGGPVDMSFCILRAMSPMHVEYLRNMHVAASMSISIVHDGLLWGLIACHHGEAKIVPHRMRATCEVLARFFSSHIAASEKKDEQVQTNALELLKENIEARLRTSRDILTTLSDMAADVLKVFRAEGCTYSIGGKIVSFGIVPDPVQLKNLLSWLCLNQPEHILASEQITSINPSAEEFSSLISGLLSIRIALQGPDFLVYFRPPVVRVVTWAGNPGKPVHKSEVDGRVSPRRSFERWKQTSRNTSEPWTDPELKFSSMLRPIIAELMLLHMNEEIVRLNVELNRSNGELESFSYMAGHDLQEPVRAIRIYAQLLTQRGVALTKESQMLLQTIVDSAGRMGSLISSMLNHSQIGGADRSMGRSVNLEDVLNLVVANLSEQIRESSAVITNSPLPIVHSDPGYVEQLLQNLVSNSLKYRQPDISPRIHISSRFENNFALLSVCDNGEGFDPKHAEMIFAPFKRLHGREVPGSGVGLASCKRIVERHQGRIWAESLGLNSGATFWFTLPLEERSAETNAP